MYSRPVIWKNSWPVLAPCLALLAPAYVWADAGNSIIKDELGISGTVRGAYFSTDMSFDGESGFGVGSVWMTASPQKIDSVSFYFDGKVQGQNLTRDSDAKWDVREGYAEISFGDMDLRAGRQIIVWGRADKVNPTDVWSTRDYKLLVTDDEDQRLGAAGLQGTLNLGNYRVIGIWQPEWRSPVYPIAPFPSGIALQGSSAPDALQQMGLKLDHSGDGIDWSVSYAHTIDRTPGIAVLSASGPQAADLGLIYHYVDVAGADFALPVGEYGLRGEGAYTRTQKHDATDTSAENSNLFIVLGGERTFGGELNVNTQFLYKRVCEFQTYAASAGSLLLASVAEQEAIESNQLAAHLYGASFRLNYKMWNETLESEIAGVTWVNTGEYALRPKISYAFTDHIKGIVGGQIYAGPHDSFFGQFNEGSTAFVEMRAGF